MVKSISSKTQKKYNDQALLDGLKTNDRACTQHLYHQAYPLVAAQLRRMGAKVEDIRDIFQDGMVILWKNARDGSFQLKSDTRLSTYLVHICKWRWLDRKKKASSRLEVPMNLGEDQTEAPSFLQDWIKEEELARFRQVFHQLGESCQKLLNRFYFQKQSMKEIAQAFALTDATARNKKYRCMQKLKSLYQQSS